MLIAVCVLAGLLILVVVAAGGLARAASRTSTLTLAEPSAVEGELLLIDPGAEFEETIVVRRVMPDRTLSHVVLVRPFRPWHRFRWTRRWL